MLTCDNFPDSVFDKVFFRSLIRCYVECPSIGICLMFFPLLAWAEVCRGGRPRSVEFPSLSGVGADSGTLSDNLDHLALVAFVSCPTAGVLSPTLPSPFCIVFGRKSLWTVHISAEQSVCINYLEFYSMGVSHCLPHAYSFIYSTVHLWIFILYCNA